ncbi:MAG: class I SAM-dependent methyltransferase [Verrucomicrobiota bacterium]
MNTASVYRSCPLCEREDGRPWLAKGALLLEQCPGCSMIYANPVSQELASGEFYGHLATPFYLSPEKLEGDYAPVRFEREMRLFRAHCPRGTVLDVGCSTGAFLFQLRSRFPDAYAAVGNDVAGPALEYAAGRGLAVIRSPFLDCDFQGRQFEAVTFWAVLEHLMYPQRFLDKAAALLKPRGLCFILVPNMKSLAVRLLGAKYRYILPQHLNYFTPSTLRLLAESAADLSVMAAGSTHFNPLVILSDFFRGTEEVPDEDRARLLKRTTAYKQKPALKPLKLLLSAIEMGLGSLNLADNLFVVLRKREGGG